MKSLKIGNIKLKNPLLLAPMVDVSDLPFRLLCRKEGAAMAYTEMLYTSQILHENSKTVKLMKTSKSDKPLGIQITGNNLTDFSSVIPHLKPFNLIDLNCGCPSIKITGNQAGSYLLKNPSKISKIIRTLKTSNMPVTAKIRLGFKKNNALKIAKEIEKAGADALSVHARLAIHGKSIPADWKELKKIRNSISLPLIGNGDIFSGSDVSQILDICDGAMIARGAIGDPSVFSRILKYLKTGKESALDPKKNLKYLKEYLALSKKYGTFDLGRAKYLGSQFIKGFQGSAQYRAKFSRLKTLKEMSAFIDKAINEL